MLKDPTKEHTIQDDLESSFWILLWTCLRYIPSNLRTEGFIHIMDLFSTNAAGTPFAATTKHAPLLNQLIEYLGDLFEPWVYYNAKLQKIEEKASNKAHKCPHGGRISWWDVTALNPIPANLPKSDDVIRLFDDVLASPGWPAMWDMVIPKIPRHAPHSNSKLKRSSDFEGDSTAKILRR
ncbi:hypothetical protein NEOLEDRAFT_1183196 [Neolentinus lepideus HHB14362 ss-1]|uniref:Fungal-type protein kinase domain-containing protein n=1 Tax=Neolentinus lepideus HHB14362 ss-1 TaxID=1314782 RepID=A0A165NH09_9AGAM|nr:hypothetical protein NEOLEDRAFT_1183196 [Neolentinus lepideus HHB14362 ss-1]